MISGQQQYYALGIGRNPNPKGRGIFDKRTRKSPIPTNLRETQNEMRRITEKKTNGGERKRTDSVKEKRKGEGGGKRKGGGRRKEEEGGRIRKEREQVNPTRVCDDNTSIQSASCP
ncbi:hypothetical protein CPC08DRAFT_216238 [Agrocybe pediades]|nr:hypothetical protein CPC08DRAFT_216238 [Agrocybe pediades]